MKQMEPRRDGGGVTIERLESAVTRLVAGQDALIARIDSLEKALAERGRRIGELEGLVHASEEKRARALDRLDSLIGQLDELEGRAESVGSLAVDPQ